VEVEVLGVYVMQGHVPEQSLESLETRRMGRYVLPAKQIFESFGK